ncbi:hypothetical protein GT347_01420 [Xylophilus rhododendri]|uniref:Zinc-dependent peptidase n=1 Tax=Xylophilus rhododendri TaxID=2697032 RepID=A0A857J1L8_9BURK|nr:M90 family metallopeptidase [Xylophilus rhododendri]QHI96765.1 hypothetical protein GT347_01420 [Xylophilus rhododendri]
MRLWRQTLDLLRRSPRPIPDRLWAHTLRRWPFLAEGRSAAEIAHLRELAGHFLRQKQFHGAHGLVVSDEMACAIAAQACLPLLHFGPARKALRWYGDFVMIVVQPGEAVAQREVTDEAGVVHRYREVLAGEAMERGPVMLSWADIEASSALGERGYSVVIHEFVHKIDMHDGQADGLPPLPPGFLGSRGVRQARAAWLAVLEPVYEDFREKVIRHERFGAAEPWLDPYGAQSLTEFLPVACEAYFTRRARFGAEVPALLALFDRFFQRPSIM